MRKLAFLLFLAIISHAQVNVSVSPVAHQTFVDNSGSPCAGCKLYSYLGGTTTPTPTYVDSTGTSMNTNPIILDIAGGGNIWLNNTLKYKFALVDSLGTTVWTVDNVSGSGGGGSLPCTTAYAISYTNAGATALTCDPTILIDPSSHSIQVGGPISGPFFSLHNNATIPASWTFDITTPTSALASLGTIPYTQFPQEAADTLIMNATAATATPTAVGLPPGCTNGVNYSTSTHSWTCITAATLPLSALAAQAADTVVMNATGGSASPTAVAMPPGCTSGVTYNTSTHAWSCVTSTALTCTGTTPPWSCYSVDSQGTITEFGIVLASTTSNTIQTVSIAFPLTFPTQQSLTVSGGGQVNGTDDNYTVFHRGLSSTGATVVIHCAVNIGGSGCSSISSQVPINWEAKGK